MNARAVDEHVWWLASRASGIVALVLVTTSVIIGLAMSGKVARSFGHPRVFVAIHEQAAVTAMIAIAIHGVTLLGDPFLRPGLSGISVPFTIEYRPVWTGLGIIGGYLATAFGLSFYARQRIGARTWRKAHRFAIVVYLLALAHTLGAGSDVGSVWMQVWLWGTTPLVIALFAIRVWASRKKPATSRPHAPPRPSPTPTGRPAEEAA